MEDDKEKNPAPDGTNPTEGKEKNPAPDGGEPKESEIIKKIKEDFEAKEAALKADYEKQLADKDAIILEILDGGRQPQGNSLADRINQKRNFKKY